MPCSERKLVEIFPLDNSYYSIRAEIAKGEEKDKVKVMFQKRKKITFTCDMLHILSLQEIKKKHFSNSNKKNRNA